MGHKQYSAYGSKILATLSQRLTARYGKGYTYTAISSRATSILKFLFDGHNIDTFAKKFKNRGNFFDF